MLSSSSMASMEEDSGTGILGPTTPRTLNGRQDDEVSQ